LFRLIHDSISNPDQNPKMNYQNPANQFPKTDSQVLITYNRYEPAENRLRSINS